MSVQFNSFRNQTAYNIQANSRNSYPLQANQKLAFTKNATNVTNITRRVVRLNTNDHLSKSLITFLEHQGLPVKTLYKVISPAALTAEHKIFGSQVSKTSPQLLLDLGKKRVFCTNLVCCFEEVKDTMARKIGRGLRRFLKSFSQ